MNDYHRHFIYEELNKSKYDIDLLKKFFKTSRKSKSMTA
jgi:hypothetical protein